MPLSDQFWGDRYGHLRDPFGFTWAIATRKEDLTPEELRERSAKVFSGSAHP
jgi:PhnB protein